MIRKYSIYILAIISLGQMAEAGPTPRPTNSVTFDASGRTLDGKPCSISLRHDSDALRPLEVSISLTKLKFDLAPINRNRPNGKMSGETIGKKGPERLEVDFDRSGTPTSFSYTDTKARTEKCAITSNPGAGDQPVEVPEGSQAK